MPDGLCISAIRTSTYALSETMTILLIFMMLRNLDGSLIKWMGLLRARFRKPQVNWPLLLWKAVKQRLLRKTFWVKSTPLKVRWYVQHDALSFTNLKTRYQAKLISTYSGLFLIYINRVVKIFLGVPPHLPAISDGAFMNMLQGKWFGSSICDAIPILMALDLPNQAWTERIKIFHNS